MEQGDLTKFGGSLTDMYGIDFSETGGLPKVDSQKSPYKEAKPISRALNALGNIILGTDGVDEFVQNRPQRLPEFGGGKVSDAPLVPTQTQQSDRSQRIPLEPYTPPRDPTPATTTTPTVVGAYDANQQLIKDLLSNLPGYQERALQGRLKEAEAVGAQARKRDVIAEWGAITRAEIAKEQALAQSLMVTSVYANTPNVSVMQAMNATAPSVIGAYKMGSSVLK